MASPTKAASISSDPMPKAYSGNRGTSLVEPALPDVLAAAARIRPYLAPTLFRQSPAVSEIVGADVYLKHEFHLPPRAFKVRGGVILLTQLRDQDRAAGL